MSPTCPLVYIHRYTTYNTIYTYTYANIFPDFFYEHINLICTHVYIHNYIYPSIHFVIFFLASPAWTVKLPLHWTPGRAAIWALSWIWLIKKVSCWGKLAWQQLGGGGWLGYSCGLADFCRPWIFFLGVCTFLVSKSLVCGFFWGW